MSDSSKQPLGRRMKAHAPPPPQAPQPAPRHIFRNQVPNGGETSGMDTKENMLKPTVNLQLTLPQGYQTSVTEDGSKALMDLLVELCSHYHLNPGLHTLELLSPEGHSLGFKPNTLLGSLNVASVLIKEKVWEDKVIRRQAPKVPEKTVRLMVNYHSNQKAVVRVNPLVPLQALIPVICEKCEFDPAHILLLKDSISRHELPLHKSLTELGIKELYIHDQSIVVQPKMASTPALNFSDSICSSTTSLGRPEKKGLLGILQFSRKKSKTETSVDMDNYDDKVIQNSDRESNGLSTVSGVHGVEVRPRTLGQSQSVMNIPRMSPKAEAKKRRAPAPPGALICNMDITSFEGYQLGLGSENQQRKRKAPAPPPTPASITPGSDNTSTSAAPSPDSHSTETPTPAFCTMVAQSIPVSSTIIVTETIKPVTKKTAAQPPTVQTVAQTASSPTPSSSATDSLALQDSNSELSHSLDNSDTDFEQAGSHCSTLTSSTVSEFVEVQPTRKSSSSRRVEDKASSMAALNLKVDEVENNRHSTMAWLHSMHSSRASGQKPETETLEEETLSMGSSSGGSSLPDQGYAASEGMVEGEDSGMVSSTSDTQPTSPDGSLSLDGSSRSGGERLLGPVRDNSSDSDEGCATWVLRHRHSDISSQARRLKDSFEDDPELTAQLHDTLAVFEADLADHTNFVSAKETPYTMSTGSSEVPVSVVDMDVPVTAIDEVLEDYEHNAVENKEKSLIRTESTDKDVKRDLSFLKPSRQTSSQYVASAISKYTPKTSAKPNPIPNIPNCSVKTQTTAFQRSSRSMPMNPRWSDNKENGSADSKPNPTSPNKSMNYPEFISHSRPVRLNGGGFGSCNGSTKTGSDMLETGASKKKHIQCSDPIQINVTANNDRDNIKHFGPGSPTLSQSRPLHSSAKQPAAPKTISQGQASNKGDMTKVATHPTPDVKALPSVTVSDSTETSEYPQVTVFGPIKKFKPVICGSVEKETSLHSSLMEAIQTGGGRDRLKKISTSSPTSIRKASYVEEENERSALLSAIRAPRNSDRLRKTTSDAAVELEKFRKVTSEEERSADPSPPPSPPTLSFTSPPVFSPPPPPRPQGPMVVPPPPLPVLPQGKSSTVAHPNANTPVNPALAREAMLEAIRSGSAAVRLKKVTVPTKTLQVNGKLGTIQAASPALPQK
ncbi:protein cordon-bleu isoform X6 [Mastacembelus armatus]|uniref:protein cordon-bleu isoform X6 n=1 Tax=Mastacembelus armatus TaxID=205130 RepID=UPI000E4658FD|nr:protein cordon-bleu isoform X6 [Mastacembelus armatus]